MSTKNTISFLINTLAHPRRNHPSESGKTKQQISSPETFFGFLHVFLPRKNGHPGGVKYIICHPKKIISEASRHLERMGPICWGGSDALMRKKSYGDMFGGDFLE